MSIINFFTGEFALIEGDAVTHLSEIDLIEFLVQRDFTLSGIRGVFGDLDAFGSVDL